MRYIFLFVFLLFSISGYSQFKNTVLDTQDTFTQSLAGPGVAISLKNKDNIVTASILDKVYYTKDGGDTWTKSNLKSSFGVYGNPVVISDKKGDFYYFHLSDPARKNETKLDRIVSQRSKDGGETWSDGESIGYNHPKDQDKEWAVADPHSGNLYVLWTQFDDYGAKDSTCQSNILFSESHRGNNWSDPIKINAVPGNCIDDDNTTAGAVPVAGPDGRLYIAWAYQGKIYLDRSFDKGKTWLRNDMEITRQAGGWSLNIPGLKRSNGTPILVCDNSPTQYNGSLYLNWSDQRNGQDDTDIWFMASRNHGDFWGSLVRVNDDTPGNHQFLSWMTVDQTSGIIYILYYDRRNADDLQTEVYLAYSINGGNSFVNQKISKEPFTSDAEQFFGDYTNICANDGRIAAVWTRMDDGKTSIIACVIDQKDLIPELKSSVKNKKKKK